MTVPSAERPQPPKLSWLTWPLMVGLVYQAFTLLTVPFAGDSLQLVLTEMETQLAEPLPPLPPEFIQTVLWLAFFLTAFSLLLYYYTYCAVREGKPWGRSASLILAIASLPVLPFGTLLGIVMLIGCFDDEVKAFFRTAAGANDKK